MQSDNRAGHLPIFEKLLASFRIHSVLEFGMGNSSTPFFLERCGIVVSIEQDSQERYDRLTAGQDKPNWEPFFECNPARVFEHFEGRNRQFDLVFCDGAPETRYLVTNLAMRKNIPFIALHDGEEIWRYRWHLLDIPPAYYRFNFRRRSDGKVTSIIANAGREAIDKWDLPEYDKVIHAYTSPRQPVFEVQLKRGEQGPEPDVTRRISP